MNRAPLYNDTIGSVLRHREVGRAKDLSASPRLYMFLKRRLIKKFFKSVLVVNGEFLKIFAVIICLYH